MTYPSAAILRKEVGLVCTRGHTWVGEMVAAADEASRRCGIVLVGEGGARVVCVLGGFDHDKLGTIVCGALHVHVWLVCRDVEALEHAGAGGTREA